LKRTALYIGGIVLVIIIGIALWLFSSSGKSAVKNYVFQRLVNTTGYDISAKSFETNYFSYVTLHDLRLSDSTTSSVVEISRVTVDFQVFPVIRGHVIIDSLVSRDINIRVQQEFLNRFTRTGDDRKHQAARQKSRWSWDIGFIEARNASVTYQHSANRILTRMEKVDLLYFPNDSLTMQAGYIRAEYQDKTVDDFNLALKAVQADKAWQISYFSLKSRESGIKGTGDLVPGNRWKSTFSLTGTLGRDLQSVFITDLPADYRGQIQSTDIRFDGAAAFSQDSLRYSATIRTDSIGLDTIAIRKLRLRLSGDNNKIGIQQFRAVLGSELDTLNLVGEYDWFNKHAKLRFNGHFTSLDYLKHLFNQNVPVNSPVNLSLTADIPYEDLKNATGTGRIQFIKPSVYGDIYDSIETRISLSENAMSSRTRYRTNVIEIDGQLEWPFRFHGALQFDDFSEFDSSLVQSIRPVMNSEFSGVLGAKEQPIIVRGEVLTELMAETTPEVDIYPIKVRLPFRASNSGARVDNGSVQISNFRPSSVSSDIRWENGFTAFIDLLEPVKTEGTDTYGNLHVQLSTSDTSYTGLVDIQNLSLERWSRILPRTQRQVAGNFNLSSQFTMDSTGITGSGNMRLTNGKFAQSALDSANFRFEWNREGIALIQGKAYSKHLTADVSGFLPFADQDSMKIEVSGKRWPLDVANPFLPGDLEISGLLNPSLSVNGSYLNPSVHGIVEVDSARLSWGKNQIPVRDLQSRVTFSDTSYQVEFAQFRYQDYPVTLTGNGTLQPSFNGEISLQPSGTIAIVYTADQNHSVMAHIREFPAQVLQQFIPAELRHYGYINARLNAANISKNITLETDGSWSEENEESLAGWTYQWNMNYANSLIRINESALQTSDGGISVKGRVPFDLYGGGVTTKVQDDTLDVGIQIRDLNARVVNSFTDKIHGNSGTVNSDIRVKGTWALPGLKGFLRGTEIDVQSPVQVWKITGGAIDMSFRKRDVTLHTLTANINEYPFIMDGSIRYDKRFQLDAKFKGEFNRSSPFEIAFDNDAAKDSLRGTIAFRDLSFKDILDLFHIQQNIRGNLDFTLQVNGSRANPAMQFSGDIDGLVLNGVSFHTARVRGDYHDNWFAIDTLNLNKQSAFIGGKGRVSGELDLREIRLKEFAKYVDLRFVASSFPVQSFDALFPADNHLVGVLNADIIYHQDNEGKSLSGFTDLSGIGMDIPYFEQKIQSGAAKFDFTGDEILVRNGRFLVNKRPIHLSGNVNLPANAPPAYDIAIHTERIRLSRAGEVSLTLAPSVLHLSTSAESPVVLEGTMQFNAFDYTKKVANPQLLSLIGTRTIRPRQFTTAMLEDIRLNLSIQMLKNASIHNNLADLDFTADIQLNGPVFNPRYSGRITSDKGEIYYLRRTFDIRNAEVFFTGTPEINPSINMTAVTTVPSYQNIDEVDYKITMNITNTLRQPRVELHSEPALRPHTSEPLTQSDIIGILAVGRPREQFSGVAGEGNITQVLMHQAQRFSSEKIASAMEYRVGRLLDLDRVTIEGNLFNMSGAQTPTFTAQKQLSKRLSLTYSSAIGHSNDQGIRLNYRLGSNWYLVTETSQQENYGVDVKYRIRFK